MATPAFQAEFDAAVKAYRACLEPSNLAAAVGIRDDKTMGPKARLKAIEVIRRPRPLASTVVNVNRTNNGGQKTVIPGYVIRLSEPPPKTIDHLPDTRNMVPPAENLAGNIERDIAAERAEAAEVRPRRD